MSSLDRVLLVGEDPGPSGDPDCPLLWLPRTSAGGRLADLIGDDYARPARVNVLREYPGRTWPTERAREAGAAIVRASGGRLVVALGRRVADALGVRDDLPWYSWGRLRACHSSELAIAVHPHPSRRNRMWNDPTEVAEARAFWELVRALDGDPVGLWETEICAATLRDLATRVGPLLGVAAWRRRPTWDPEVRIWRCRIRARAPSTTEVAAARAAGALTPGRNREHILRAVGLAPSVLTRIVGEPTPIEWRLCDHWRRTVGDGSCGCRE